MSDQFEHENEYRDAQPHFDDPQAETSESFEQNQAGSAPAPEPERVTAPTTPSYQPQQQYGFPGSYPQQPKEPPYGTQRGTFPTRPEPPYGSGQRPVAPAPKKNKGATIAIVILSVALIIALAAIVRGGLLSFSPRLNETSSTETGEVDASEQDKKPDSNGDSVQYATTDSASVEQLNSVQVAEKCRKSVVGVMVYSGGKLAGEGSGVVWGRNATGDITYVVTCAHVVSGGKYEFSILTLDEKSFEAELVAYDTRTDIGVLKVKTDELEPAQLGDSKTLRIGETVYAIGNPGGSEYFGSITDGIISAIDRSVSSTYTMTCIQHNAAINPGNSGGALVNSAGQVIGINSSKIADTDYEGMGFAVPMSIVHPVVEALIQNGYVPNRPKLGIQYASVNSYRLYSVVVAFNNLPAGSLVIAGIANDSSLKQTDAQVGDLIIGVNGKDMNNSSVLLDLIDTGAVGDKLTLTLARVNQKNYQITKFDVEISLVEDRGEQQTEPTTESFGYGDFEDYYERFFGSDWNW